MAAIPLCLLIIKLRLIESNTQLFCVRLNKCSLFSNKYKGMAAVKVKTFGVTHRETKKLFAHRKSSVQQRFGNTVGQCRTVTTPELPPVEGPL